MSNSGGIIINLSRSALSATLDGVTYQVSRGTARDGWGNTDTFILYGQENFSLSGSDFADYIRGRDDMSTYISGRAGNDTLHGGATTGDWAGYDSNDDGAISGAIVNLSTTAITVAGQTVQAGTALDNWQDTDNLIGIEHIRGSELSDFLVGSSESNTIMAGDGDDTLIGGSGIDSLFGEDGSDTVDYASELSAISVSLTGSTTTSVLLNGSTADYITDIENIVAGAGADTLIGDYQDNIFTGNAGKDTLDGGSGTDTANYADKTYAISVSLNSSNSVNVAVNGTTEDSIKNIENIIGGSGNDSITGDALNNTFKGNGGADTLNGGSGSDTADYSEKSTSVVVTLNGATAVNVSVGGAVEDSIKNIENIVGGLSGDTLTGDANANKLVGLAGNDSLTGGSGNDTLVGGLGADTLDGGVGTDTVVYREKTDAVVLTLNGSTAVNVTVGGVIEDSIKNIENVIGGHAADTLTGDGYGNYFYGGDGADAINGGSGVDISDYSDESQDISITLNGSTAATVWIGGAAQDTLRNIENIYSGSGSDSLTGDSNANIFRGNTGMDTINGGGGLDTADYTGEDQSISVTLNGATAATVSIGGVGEDTILNVENIYGGIASDSLIGDSSSNLFRGGLGADTLDGGSGIDTADYSDKSAAISVTLSGSTFATVNVGGTAEDSIRYIENIFGGSGNDSIIGDGNANVLRGGNGADTLNGGSGLDTADYSDKSSSVSVTLNGATAASVYVAGTAEDSILNIENILGSSAADILNGDAMANKLTGNSGNDTITGAGGNDTLIGGAGSDSLTGGSGSDIFVLDYAIGTSNIDTVSDFTTGSDKIALDDDIFTALGTVGTTSGAALSNASIFQLGTAANDALDRLIYDQSTGKLYYDADGSGSTAQVQIAIIGSSATLGASDIVVIA